MMASIEKIYATEQQYDEFYKWSKKNAPPLVNRLVWRQEWTDGGKHPICILPKAVDMWLLANCPIGFVVERIREQYNLNEPLSEWDFGEMLEILD